MATIIKLRAWDKKNKCYHKVLGIHFHDDGSIKKIRITGLQRKDYIPASAYDIEQYTGLTDVNCKDIYVGDILWAKNARWIVTDKYQMKLIGKKMEFTQMILPAFVKYIGNVHENAELMEADK